MVRAGGTGDGGQMIQDRSPFQKLILSPTNRNQILLQSNPCTLRAEDFGEQLESVPMRITLLSVSFSRTNIVS